VKKKSTISLFVWLPFTTCLVLTFLASCTPKRTKSELVWDQNFPVIGSQSSPRATDLNGDGVLDLVMGAGKNEFQHSEQGIIAINGKTGELLWQQEAPDQVYGTPTFQDINGDGVPEVFIGGRSPNLKALDGKTGEVIWTYKYQYENDPVLKYARFNFYNLIIIPDQNNDGLPDLLTVNGGNAEADPYTTENRYPGVLMVLDAKTGQVLAADTMPDGKESYMTPLCFAQPGSEEHHVIFGTGGETIDGHLYMVRLADLMDQKLSRAKIIASEKGHGFIAPPVLADINQDGAYDIVAISHGSTIFALDGKDQRLLWQQQIPNTESSNSFAVGYFTKDDVPDFFTFVSKGEWPDNTGSLQIMLDGKDGRIAYMDSIGCTGFSSPVVYDLNGDGVDEVILSINEFDCNRHIADRSSFTIVNKLISINFNKKSVSLIDQTPGFKNIFTTPWIGDMDQDGYLDIVHCQYYNYSDLLSFLGMQVKRISTPVRVKDAPVWGAYMGTKGDGIFPIKR
jgi:outer membrane protein assembly factor BamB